MTKRKWWNLTFYGTISIIGLGVIGGLVYMWREGAGTLPVSGQAPAFTATNVNGQTVSLNDLQGKVVLMTWYYTHCTDECPLTMYRFEQVQQQLEKQGVFGKNVVLIAMTLDPNRDTIPVIRQYGQHFHANLSGWYFLRTNEAQTLKILNAWGIQAKPSTDKEFIEHTSKTVLIDEYGNIRAEYNTANLNPQTITSNIDSLVSRMKWRL
ncbi:SCO family protein [Alicyclobacillus curvatus]|nr:SCO family protein [Alicyclobacillus curvatus]